MGRPQHCLLGLMAFVAPLSASAAGDWTEIRFESNSVSSVSSEATELKVSRSESANEARNIAVDKYFADVEKIATDSRLPSDWFVSAPDAPTVSVEISIHGRHHKLTMMVPASALASNERERVIIDAVRAIVSLTVRYSERRLDIGAAK